LRRIVAVQTKAAPWGVETVRWVVGRRMVRKDSSERRRWAEERREEVCWIN
jgi:hypothetical protein